MTQAVKSDWFDNIIRSSETFYTLVNDLDIAQTQKGLPAYTDNLHSKISQLDIANLTPSDIEKLEKVMQLHKQIIETVDEQKEIISNKLKKLQAGKEMQNAYP